MEIIRQLLLQVEEDRYSQDVPGYEPADVAYNAALILEQGLANGPDPIRMHGHIVRVDLDSLTWAGHDFLDAARDETIWNKAKEKFMKPGLSWTFGVLLEWLKAEIKARAGLP